MTDDDRTLGKILPEHNELYYLMMHAGELRSRETLQVSVFCYEWRQFLDQKALLLSNSLLRYHAILGKIIPDDDIAWYIRNFIKIYGHMHDPTRRAAMEEDLRLLEWWMSKTIYFGGINDMYVDITNGRAVVLYLLPRMTHISDDFLAECDYIVSIDLLRLSSVENISIGNDFLCWCTGLTSISTTGMSGVTTIGDKFLAYCSRLESIDLSGLFRLRCIGAGFLFRCTGLTSIDLTGLSGVTDIGDDFLYGCSSLTSIDMWALSDVTIIGSGFLCDCVSLISLDLTGLSKITNVGDYFLVDCPNVKVTVRGDQVVFIEKLRGIDYVIV